MPTLSMRCGNNSNRCDNRWKKYDGKDSIALATRITIDVVVAANASFVLEGEVSNMLILLMNFFYGRQGSRWEGQARRGELG